MLDRKRELTHIEKAILKKRIEKVVVDFNKDINKGKEVSSLEYDVEVDSAVKTYNYLDHNGERAYWRVIGKVVTELMVAVNLKPKNIEHLEND